VRFFKNNSGTTALEFALVFPAVIAFILGVAQIGYLLWIDNLLHYSVETASRCSAVGSTTFPCAGSGTANMATTATNLFSMAVATSEIPSGTFSDYVCGGGSGLQASFTVNFLLVVPVTVTANSCYPNFSGSD
jgi:Flp pilus assembly protein TadG